MSKLRNFLGLVPIKPANFVELKGDMDAICITHRSEWCYPDFYNQARALFIQAENAEKLFFQKEFDAFFPAWEKKARSLISQMWESSKSC